MVKICNGAKTRKRGRGETGRGKERVLFMDKEVGSDGRTEAPGSLLWLSTKLPQGLRNTEKLHPAGLVPN